MHKGDFMSEDKMARLMNRRTLISALAAGSVVPMVSGCADNSALGRNQLMLVSDNQLNRMSDQAWSESLQRERILRDPSYSRRLERIGSRMVDAAGQGHLNWEFVVIDSDTVNAWVLPNGKVAFYKGIFDLFGSDDQLATVMGHEIGHVVGRHSAERASQRMASEYGMQMLSSALGAHTDIQNSEQIAAALGAGVTFGVILPYSRQHEFEADRLGVDFMVGANYDPRQAIDFWVGMSAMNASNSSDFMSTHPSDQSRIAAMRAHITAQGYG
jgi:predicted Zn-dependent protease